MKIRLTPYYTDLVHEALLKSFWRKKTLARFLRQCDIAPAFLSTWSEEESKRDFVDRLLPVLLSSEAGRKAILKMSRLLMEQKTFPDLANWEDSDVKIREAHQAVQRLKAEHHGQQEHFVSQEEKRRSRNAYQKTQAEVAQSKRSLQELQDRLNALASQIGSQDAGYEFEKWFFDLVDYFEISNRRPYSSSGRQIDGSLTLSGTTYLVELKFTAKQAAAPDIDTFHKKVVTKADNTMGVMISMSGYSSIAVTEASGERTPLLLLDHAHLYLILGGVMTLGEVVERIRRHASQTGASYLACSDFSG